MKTARQIFCDFGHNFLLMLEAKSSGIQLFLLLQFLLLSGRRALAFPGHARWRVPSSCHCTLCLSPVCSVQCEQCAVCSVGVGGAVKCYKPGSRSRPLSAKSSP